MVIRPRSSEAGIALILVVVFLAAVGLLAAGALALALVERAGSAEAFYAAQAEYGADAGAGTASLRYQASWDTVRPGMEVLVRSFRLPGGVSVTSTIQRINGTLFLLRGSAERQGLGGVLGRRQVGRLLRQDRLAFSPPAAVWAEAVDGEGSGARVVGSDTVPPGWEAACPAPGSGVPPMGVDSGAAPQSSTLLGEHSIGELMRLADLRIGGGVGPLGLVAADSFPLLAAADGTVLSSGEGQGLLLVDGDLTIAGGFEFRGLVLALGTVRFGSGGGSVLGALSARRVELGGPGSSIAFSRCLVDRALRGAMRLWPISERSWLQLD